MTGKTFNGLKVIKRMENNCYGTAQWQCICNYCNNKCTKTSSQILSLRVFSCGCIRRQIHKEKIKKYNEYEVTNDIVKVKLSNRNKYFTCDSCDWETAKNYCWTLHHTGYPYTTIESKYITFHDYIFNNTDDTLQVDHIDINPLNNCRYNLRLVTRSQNMMNRNIFKNNTSGCTGVHYDNKREKWIARIGINNKRIILGAFNNIEDAIIARKNAEVKYFGEFRRIN